MEEEANEGNLDMGLILNLASEDILNIGEMVSRIYLLLVCCLVLLIKPIGLEHPLPLVAAPEGAGAPGAPLRQAWRGRRMRRGAWMRRHCATTGGSWWLCRCCCLHFLLLLVAAFLLLLLLPLLALLLWPLIVFFSFLVLHT